MTVKNKKEKKSLPYCSNIMQLKLRISLFFLFRVGNFYEIFGQDVIFGRNKINNLDINTLTPIEVLMKLNEIKNITVK